MSHQGKRCEEGPEGFPRVSGDEPYEAIGKMSMQAFSPRERG